MSRTGTGEGLRDREALRRAAGAYWTRSNAVEIDVVGAGREPVARRILFPGPVKWLEGVSGSTTVRPI